jgi:hypothetical protein
MKRDVMSVLLLAFGGLVTLLAVVWLCTAHWHGALVNGVFGSVCIALALRRAQRLGLASARKSQ